MGKLRVHCKLRYKRCKDLGCPYDNRILEFRRILQNDPFTFCHRACRFYAEDLEKGHDGLQIDGEPSPDRDPWAEMLKDLKEISV